MAEEKSETKSYFDIRKEKYLARVAAQPEELFKLAGIYKKVRDICPDDFVLNYDATLELIQQYRTANKFLKDQRELIELHKQTDGKIEYNNHTIRFDLHPVYEEIPYSSKGVITFYWDGCKKTSTESSKPTGIRF